MPAFPKSLDLGTFHSWLWCCPSSAWHGFVGAGELQPFPPPNKAPKALLAPSSAASLWGSLFIPSVALSHLPLEHNGSLDLKEENPVP